MQRVADGPSGKVDSHTLSALAKRGNNNGNMLQWISGMEKHSSNSSVLQRSGSYR
jgi:hypothetical protein